VEGCLWQIHTIQLFRWRGNSGPPGDHYLSVPSEMHQYNIRGSISQPQHQGCYTNMRKRILLHPALCSLERPATQRQWCKRDFMWWCLLPRWFL